MFVDGTRILQTTLDNDGTSNVTDVDMGIIYSYNIQRSLIVYGDCFSISDQYVGPD
jgi:hypothetical protein